MTQIAAWIVWAWVAVATLCSVLGFVHLIRIEGTSETTSMAAFAAACALNAILGLMLIQTLGLTV